MIIKNQGKLLYDPKKIYYTEEVCKIMKIHKHILDARLLNIIELCYKHNINHNLCANLVSLVRFLQIFAGVIFPIFLNVSKFVIFAATTGLFIRLVIYFAGF